MENLAPPLECLICVLSALEGHRSVRAGLKDFFQISDAPFARALAVWVAQKEQGHPAPPLPAVLRQSPARRALLQILEIGLAGQTIHSQLKSLESEVIRVCEEEMEDRLRQQPFRLLVPLLFLQVPAYLLLLFGPIFLHLIERLK